VPGFSSATNVSREIFGYTSIDNWEIFSCFVNALENKRLEEKMGDTEWNPKCVQIYTLENLDFHRCVNIYYPGILHK